MLASQFDPLSSTKVTIRPVGPADGPDVWALLEPVFRNGATYAIDADIKREDALSYWTSENAFVALIDDDIVGTFYIRRNQAGGGSHICNCGFVTSEKSTGRGVAREMLADALGRARQIGFRAMQFNFVLANNARAIDIWKRAGFEIIGEIPDAFDHPQDGFVNAFIMHRTL